MKTLIVALAKYIVNILFLFLCFKAIDWMWENHSVMLINIAIVCLTIMYFIREE